MPHSYYPVGNRATAEREGAGGGMTGGGVDSETVQLERVSYGLPPKKKAMGQEGRGVGVGGLSRSEGGLVFGALTTTQNRMC